jgi:hypothetical protein
MSFQTEMVVNSIHIESKFGEWGTSQGGVHGKKYYVARVHKQCFATVHRLPNHCKLVS